MNAPPIPAENSRKTEMNPSPPPPQRATPRGNQSQPQTPREPPHTNHSRLHARPRPGPPPRSAATPPNAPIPPPGKLNARPITFIDGIPVPATSLEDLEIAQKTLRLRFLINIKKSQLQIRQTLHPLGVMINPKES